MDSTAPAVVRLLPTGELPEYTYVPGTDTPHPIRDPRGHSYGLRNRTARPLNPDAWADNRNFLLAIDYFNLGYYW
jgi:uncharacterized protein